jgi:hypothetical protein
MPPATVYEWTLTYEVRGEPSIRSEWIETLTATLAELNDHVQLIYTEGLRIERTVALWEHYPPHDVHRVIIERGNVVP